MRVHSAALFKELREAHGISQEAIAKRAGILQVSVCMFEIGSRSLKREEEERAQNALRAIIQEKQDWLMYYRRLAKELQMRLDNTDKFIEQEAGAVKEPEVILSDERKQRNG